MDRWKPPCGAGFTLPELLIALAVLALLSTQAVPALNRLLARHRLHQATADIRAQLRSLQHRALAESRRIEIEIRTGDFWRIGCRCEDGHACVPCIASRHHPRVRLIEARAVHGRLGFDGLRGLATPASLVLASGPLRREIRVALSGRIRTCTPGNGTC